MTEYSISKIFVSDNLANQAVEDLLQQEGIQKDQNLDYTCGIYNSDNILVATGSCFQNSLRCLAVDQHYQGEGLMNQLISHLVTFQFNRGFHHLFVYTKVRSAKFFLDLGFYEIARVEGTLVFLENKKNGFSSYLTQLENESPAPQPKEAAIVINANPFTLGHLALIQEAVKENDRVHLFMVSEDSSLVPYETRKKLIMEATQDIPTLVYHDTGSYIISNATFPSYFLKDRETVIRTQAKLDIEVFINIAKKLGLTNRYVGEEPFSQVTNIYNDVMKKRLAEENITCTVIPRIAVGNEVISASKVRLAIKNQDLQQLKQWVPRSTYDYFMSPEAKPLIQKIQASQTVIHH